MAKNGTEFQHATSDFAKPRPVGYDADVRRDWPPSLARQEFADECDINVIMARYERTGEVPLGGKQPRYVDLAGAPQTLMETLQLLKEAEEAFMRLPAKVRREFDNDPVAFADFAMDEENLPQMREWGLAAPEVASATLDKLLPPSGGDKAPASAGDKPAASAAS